MPITFDKKAGALSISGALTIANAAEARAALISFTESSAIASVDLSGLAELDVAGIQILRSLYRTLHDAGMNAPVAGPAEGARKALDDAGFINRRGSGGEDRAPYFWSFKPGGKSNG